MTNVSGKLGTPSRFNNISEEENQYESVRGVTDTIRDETGLIRQP